MITEVLTARAKTACPVDLSTILSTSDGRGWIGRLARFLSSGLRKAFEEMGKKYHWNTFIPAFQYCTDNAGMIAITGYYKYMAGQFSDLTISSTARAEW